jgi:hypothetical protein
VPSLVFTCAYGVECRIDYESSVIGIGPTALPSPVGPHCEKAREAWKAEENLLPGCPGVFYEKHGGRWVEVPGW